MADQRKYKSVTAVQAKEAVLDALIAGISSKSIRQNLLEYTDLTFDKAIKTAIIFELSEIDNYMYTVSAQCSEVPGDEVNVLPTKTGPMYSESNVHMPHNENIHIKAYRSQHAHFLEHQINKNVSSVVVPHIHVRSVLRETRFTISVARLVIMQGECMSQKSNSVKAYVASTITNCHALTTTYKKDLF
ncbi:hypothetical protein GJ496_004152 [Pomphorhynchus laevis]|nr:hypothetical protein GJ496_004152 [Pomphorhynchus laevis]